MVMSAGPCQWWVSLVSGLSGRGKRMQIEPTARPLSARPPTQSPASSGASARQQHGAETEQSNMPEGRSPEWRFRNGDIGGLGLRADQTYGRAGRILVRTRAGETAGL